MDETDRELNQLVRDEEVRIIASAGGMGNFSSARWAQPRTVRISTPKDIQALVADLSHKERSDYKIADAILRMCGDDRRGSFEVELSDSIANVVGRKPQQNGFFVPMAGVSPNYGRPQMAGLDTKTNAAGKYTVATEVLDLIELLRNRMLVFKLGATLLSGLQGNIQFPKQLTQMIAYWVPENPGTDVTQSDVTFGALTLSPKTLQATTAYSRQLLSQSTVDIENMVRNELATIHALAIDLAAINGLGTGNQPTGVLRTTGIGDVAIGPAGGVPTSDHIVDLETKIATSNADANGMKFLTTPAIRGKLRKTQQTFGGTPNQQPVWQSVPGSPGLGVLDGYEAYVSNQVPSNLVKGASTDCHAIIFGYWPTIMVGEWGVIEIVVDPYALKKQGMIEVTSFQMVDVGVRLPQMMSAIQDARIV